MERMIVVVFSDETKAYEGSRALQQLDSDGNIVVYASAVVTKKTDGKLTANQITNSLGVDTLTGTAIGSLIGLLGGPIGIAVGAAGGALVGSLFDLDSARVDADFLKDVSQILTPGKTALVAEINEDWTTPVDTTMESVGGVVIRRSLTDVIESQDQRSIDALKADIANLRLEHAQAKAERKEKLNARIESLQNKLHNKLEQWKTRREAIQHEAEARIEMLKTKAAKAEGNIKAKQEQRIASIKKAYDEWIEGLDKRAAGSGKGHAGGR